MAEFTVNFVLHKLGDMIVNEAQLLGGVGNQVKWVETELTRIKCCLKDADSKQRKGDERAKNWLNELRVMAYRIEDATDTFYLQLEDNSLHVEDNRRTNRKFLQKLKRLFCKPMEVRVRHKLSRELRDIQKGLEGVSRSRLDYAIEPLQGKDDTVLMTSRRAAYDDVDETEVVGLDADRNNILKLLRREETRRQAVITIVGTGGLGKTTLARMVYKSAKADFSFHIMLSVSQQFSLADLLKKILKYSQSDKQELDELISKVKDLLSNRRYLIILDDVWVVEFWEQLKRALPDDNNGSRVLMTSRNIEVARKADKKMEPYEISFLNYKDSLDLLLKKALPSGEFPSELFEVANQLSEKCKGLPLALIVVGGILSTKGSSHHAWTRVLRTMDWHEDGKDCMKVLAMSYEDMPYYLKACFLYLASFPEDYEISAKRLIRIWIAEGFIPQQERTAIAEDKAEDCLDQLVQRCMVKVSSRSPNGSIKYLGVHDLLRDLAVHEAKKEIFVTVFPKPQNINQPDRVTRRTSIQSCSSEFQFVEYIGSNIRSFLWFCLKSNLPNYSEFKLLRVLEITGVEMPYPTDLKGIDRLIFLKYLGFRDCRNLSMPRNCSFGRLKNLETLDLSGILMAYPPADFWTTGTLRHVLYGSFIPGPPSTADLRNLHTVKWISGLETHKNQFPHLNNLRKLGLSPNNLDDVPHLLEALPSLISLGIIGWQIPMKIVYPRALPNYQNLQALQLKGTWSKNASFEASLFPPHLLKLTLINSDLGKDPMLELGKLKSLKVLRLEGNVYNWKQINCPTGFPLLQSLVLNITVDNVRVLKVAKGVMPELKYLIRGYRIMLELPPELKHVTISNLPG